MPAKGQPGKPNRTSFQQGLIPWNKGVKGLHLSPLTQFRNGVIPLNKLAEGTITVRTDKEGKPRQWVKLPHGWIPYAQLVWEDTYGPLFSGDIPHHLDGNSVNDAPENIIAIPRSHHPFWHNRYVGAKPMPDGIQKAYMRIYVARLEL